MQRVATFTKIHGIGNEVIINGMVNKEIEMQIEKKNEELRKKDEELRNLKELVYSLEKKRSRMLQEKYNPMLQPCKIRPIEKVGLIFAEIICRSRDFVYIEYPEWIERR